MAPNLTCLNNLSIYALCFHNQAVYGGEAEFITPPLINLLPIWLNCIGSFPIIWREYSNKSFCEFAHVEGVSTEKGYIPRHVLIPIECCNVEQKRRLVSPLGRINSW